MSLLVRSLKEPRFFFYRVSLSKGRGLYLKVIGRPCSFSSFPLICYFATDAQHCSKVINRPSNRAARVSFLAIAHTISGFSDLAVPRFRNQGRSKINPKPFSSLHGAHIQLSLIESHFKETFISSISIISQSDSFCSSFLLKSQINH